MQLAGFLPYVTYGSEEQSGGATSSADFNYAIILIDIEFTIVPILLILVGGLKLLVACLTLRFTNYVPILLILVGGLKQD